MQHPPLLPRLLQVIAGVQPPGAVTADRKGEEILLRAQGGKVPWYVACVQLQPDPKKTVRWPLLWLDTWDAEREPGWLVVLTDNQEVMEWLESSALMPRHGVATVPLALNLSLQVETLRRPREPLLTAAALWSGRGRPLDRLRPIFQQLIGELVQKDDVILAVPLLRGVLALRPDLRQYLPGLLRHVALQPARPPRWWSAALEPAEGLRP